MEKPKVAVIVVNWQHVADTLRCLASVSCLNYPNVETIVVDNGCDQSAVHAILTRYPDITLIRNGKNLGYTGPGVQVESFRVEVCHIGISGPAVAPLHLDGPTFVIFGQRIEFPCVVRGHVGLDSRKGGQGKLPLDTLWPYACYDLTGWGLDTPREVDAVQGACMILRRQALDQVGLLDEDYFIYSEEVDLCHRLRQHGWKIYWVPQAVVVHYGGQSTRQATAAMFLHLYQGKVLYFRKHYGWLAVQAYKLILLAAALLRLLLSPVAWLERPPQRTQHLVLANHYRRLVRALPGM